MSEGAWQRWRPGRRQVVAVIASCLAVVIVGGAALGWYFLAGAGATAQAKQSLVAAQTAYAHETSLDRSRTAALNAEVTTAVKLDRTASSFVASGSGLIGASSVAALRAAEKGLAVTLKSKSASPADAHAVKPIKDANAAEYKRLARSQREQTTLVSAHVAATEQRIKSLQAATGSVMTALQQAASSVASVSASVLTTNNSASSATRSAYGAAVAALKTISGSTLLTRLQAYFAAAAALVSSNKQALAAQAAVLANSTESNPAPPGTALTGLDLNQASFSVVASNFDSNATSQALAWGNLSLDGLAYVSFTITITNTSTSGTVDAATDAAALSVVDTQDASPNAIYWTPKTNEPVSSLPNLAPGQSAQAVMVYPYQITPAYQLDTNTPYRFELEMVSEYVALG